MKKFLAMIMALAMILSLATTAYAEDNYTITINNDAPNHVYQAYQIFKGTLTGAADNDNEPDTEAVLSDIEWGDSVVITENMESAESVAKKLSDNELTVDDLIEMINDGTIELTAAAMGESTFDGDDTYTISNLPAGYYLVKDKENVRDEDGNLITDTAYTEYILEVLEDSTVNPKGDVPEFVKKIKDINNSTEVAMSDWQDSADHDIGDIIPYQLTATLPNNLERYEDGYKLVFHDFLSPGLTFQNITSAKIINKDGEEIELDISEDTTDYVKTYTECADIEATTNIIEDSKLTITIADVTDLGGENGCQVVFEYNALLNEEAVHGKPGNPNEAYLEYDRYPYEGYEPGETPRDRVIAFTYKVIVNKVRENGKNEDGTPKYEALAGATFELKKWVKSVDENGVVTEDWVVQDVVTTEAGTIFTFEGLDDGWYCLEETDAPDGYNAIDPIYFNVTAEHVEFSDDPQLNKLETSKTSKEGPDATSGNLGTFEVVHDEVAGSMTTDVVNKAGVQLPETGGMGTTIFYAAGALLVVCAVILLITKKRMTVAE